MNRSILSEATPQVVVDHHDELGIPCWYQPDYSLQKVAALKVYLISLDADTDLLKLSFAGISSEERARAERFVQNVHRSRYALSHYALRTILASEFGCRPDRLNIGVGRFGRPFLRESAGVIDFNLSHSGAWAVLAVSTDTPVGIDIEVLDASTHHPELVPHVLTLREQTAFNRQEHSLQRWNFLKYWTAKEAFMKLNGLGLQLNPTAIEVDWGQARLFESHGSVVACRQSKEPVYTNAQVTTIDTNANVVCTLATPLRAARITLQTHFWESGLCSR